MTEHVELEIQDLEINTENMIDLGKLIKLIRELLNGEDNGEVPT